MSPLNRGPLLGPRAPPAPPMRPPLMARYGRAPLPPPPPPGMTRGVLPPPPPGAMFGPRGRPIPPHPGRPGPMMALIPPPPGPHGMYGHPRVRPPVPPPMPHMPPMPLRGGPMLPHGPMMRPGPRGVLPPHALPHMRPRFPNNYKGKKNNGKKPHKIEELELKKPWMTDEIRSEIQKKNKLYAKAKKNKDAKEWEEFKDLRNKVTRMIRDAKNEYLAKNPEQAHLYENDDVVEENDSEDDDTSDDEEDKESNVSPYCETCDREFQSDEMLERHLSEHQTCSIDGCTFTAHPKIVEKHISMQHSTGLYKRMKNLMSDEDIQKWRAERKKKYPTSINLQNKESECVEKEKRGEVIKNHNGKLRRDSVRKEQVKKNRKRKRNKQLQIPSYKEPTSQQTYRGIKPFAGTALLDEPIEYDSPKETVINEVVEVCKIEILDEENVVENSVINEKSKIEPVPKLISLVADYGSNSESDEPPDEIPIKKLKANDEEEPSLKSESQIPLVETKNVAKREEPKISEPISKKLEKPKQKCEKSATNQNSKAINHKNQKGYEYSNGRLRLLNKLLTRSIQHERNAIFQCITFIANNNFFD